MAIFILCAAGLSMATCVKRSGVTPELIPEEADGPQGVSADALSKLDTVGIETSSTGRSTSAETGSGERVEIELFAMSKCPFFSKFIGTLHPVVAVLSPHIRLILSHIGKVNKDGISSMHGPDEVLGNVLQLCAQRSSTSPIQLLDFMKCQYDDSDRFPNNWRRCAGQSGLDVAEIAACRNGPIGNSLLRASISRAEAADVRESPTVYIGGAPHERALSASSITRAICDGMQGTMPTACTTLPTLPEIPVTIVNDARCRRPECDPQVLEGLLNRHFSGAVFDHVDISEKRGRTLFLDSGIRFLPIAFFDASIEKNADAFERLRRSMLSMANERYALPIGRQWDPVAEICDDGIDNTKNGKIDCQDPHCAAKLICRKQQKRSLTLFVMSYCPYCTIALGFMEQALDHFGRNRQQIDFKIEFVGEEEDGDFYSLHGDREIEENLRQICAQQHYGEKYAFMTYIACRNKMSAEPGREAGNMWQQCVPQGMDAAVIQACAKGKEGRDLLSASFDRSEQLGVQGTPTWILNNQYRIEARSAADIIEAFCAANKDSMGCKE
ncbi:MAG: hypothetical protein QNJ97_08560 [Myxococcota bacterium]|nr:hypothetical protein [Myxococcota bacterium]